MSKNNISDELMITTSARLSNEVGLNNLSLKMIAEELNIKSPSLYNHISSLDDIKEKLMICGWKELGEKATESAVGVAGYEALRNMNYDVDIYICKGDKIILSNGKDGSVGKEFDTFTRRDDVGYSEYMNVYGQELEVCIMNPEKGIMQDVIRHYSLGL